MNRAWSLAIVGLGAAVALINLPAMMASQPTLAIGAMPAAFSAESVGLRFGARSQLNQAEFSVIEYFGDCAGVQTSELAASFISDKTPPAPYRRVIIHNITKGISANPYPFTNREYDERRSSSETARTTLGTTHDGKYFNLIEGANEFEYEIKERDRVIDSGKFSAQIAKSFQRVHRDAEWETKKVCKNSSVSLDECGDVRVSRQFKCSDGKVLKSFLEPDDSETYTRISNHTRSVIVFEIDGDTEVLDPGEARRYPSSSYGLKVRFNNTCADCDPNTSTNLTIGKRYVFKKTGSSSGKLLQLVPNRSN